MGLSGGYKTKQSQLVLSFLMANRDRHLIADEVVEHLKQQGTGVSKATVYRQLDRLVK